MKKPSLLAIDPLLAFKSGALIFSPPTSSSCDGLKPGCPLTTRQPAKYSWMSDNPTPLMKIGQSLLCTGVLPKVQTVLPFSI